MLIEHRCSNGSIFQRKDGSWSVVVHLGNGKRKQIVRKTKEQANSDMRHWLMENGYIEFELSGCFPAHKIVDEFIESYLTQREADGKTSSRTIENYVYMLRPFREQFADIPLRDISTAQLNRWFRFLENKKDATGQLEYGQYSLDRILYVTKALFNRAYRKKWIALNPFDDEELSKPISRKKAKQVEGFSDEELAVIIPAFKPDLKLFAPFTMLIETGMRSEELLALTWKDYNPDTGEVIISKAKTYQTIIKKGKIMGHKSCISETKQGTGNQVVWLSEQGRAIMNEWREWAPLHTCTKTGPTDFMFGNSRNPQWTHSGLYSAFSKKIKSIPNAPDTFRLHRVRHLVGTMLAESGATEYAVMQQLGHTKSETTLRYIDNSKRINANNAKLLQRAREQRNLA